VGLTEGNRKLILETRGSILIRSVIRKEDDVDGRASVTKDSVPLRQPRACAARRLNCDEVIQI